MTPKLYYCVYDNPATMCRECYCNKKLQWVYTLNMLSVKGTYMKTYLWKTNQLIDSYKALPDKYLRIYMEY